MTVVLDGDSLTLTALERVARAGEAVELSPSAIERMRWTRAVAEAAFARGEEVYGLTTGAGVKKNAQVDAADSEQYNRDLILGSRVGFGPEAAGDLARATMACLANSFAKGTVGARPELAACVIAALNDGFVPRIRTIGSIGQADLTPLADLAHELLTYSNVTPAPGEGLALIDSNAFSTAGAALAVADCRRLLDSLDVAGALELEAFAANLTILHPAVAAAKPHPGIRQTIERLRALLDGSLLWEPGRARNLQDPLTFRCLPQVQGTARDALAHAVRTVETELNAFSGNPLVVADENRVISQASVEALPVAAALDFLRIVLASALTAANERMIKLLQRPLSGLPEGLAATPASSQEALSELAITGQALTAEARLLAQPVSFELASSSHQEGIEDRMTMAPLAARRLAEMTVLGERLVVLELVVAAQAIDLRETPQLGIGTRRAYELIRELVPFVGSGEVIAQDLEPVAELVRSGALR